MLSDWHIGAQFKNIFGIYDADVAKERLDVLLDAVRDKVSRFGCRKAHVVILGDMISGNIHRSIQVTNRENVIEQIMTAADLLESFIYRLSNVCEDVRVYSVGGNHSRIAAKDDALKDERLDQLLPYIVKKSLSHLNSVHFVDSDDATMCVFSVKHYTYVAVHGDCDSISQEGVSRITSMLGEIPYAVLMGHLHHSEYRDINGTKVVMSGCLQGGGDEYTIQRRLVSDPSQTILICDSSGIIAHIPVNLD